MTGKMTDQTHAEQGEQRGLSSTRGELQVAQPRWAHTQAPPVGLSPLLSLYSRREVLLREDLQRLLTAVLLWELKNENWKQHKFHQQVTDEQTMTHPHNEIHRRKRHKEASAGSLCWLVKTDSAVSFNVCDVSCDVLHLNYSWRILWEEELRRPHFDYLTINC